MQRRRLCKIAITLVTGNDIGRCNQQRIVAVQQFTLKIVVINHLEYI
jgi:hypothetical protein